jgi:hypothetical protein
MAFACCGYCGHVVSRHGERVDYWASAGHCSECGRLMYWTATPFSHMLIRKRTLTERQESRPAA